ncbi:G-type lectin S-receptor-like serine/threonine-protein kinase At4g27290 [Bidens hawaiensis]|uniref:G-type lectin S-receptor-like serine/threonine-protein kinase At4g27290 n=1 Tax=Bidens hawaiensis TaxID=980011 RepID=UPI004049B4DC
MEVAAIFLLAFPLLFFHKRNAAELVTISASRFLTEQDTLVSETGIFELGFFPEDSSRNIYLGIRYKQITVSTLVWVANRNQPLDSTAGHVLKITDPGALVLLSNISMIIWSSNTTTESMNATAKLSDTGNLVLMDRHAKVIWQSFDYPTEHWLPGMKIGYDYVRGINWQLSSWKTGQRPVVGEFTWGNEIYRYPDDKIKQGSLVVFRGGPWRNERFKGISPMSRNLTFTYTTIVNKSEASYAYSYENSSFLFRITLSSSGKLESWGWMEDGNKWEVGVSFPKDICDAYNICHAYASCSLNMNVQSCDCLDETRFVPRSKKDWEMADWSGGCVRRTPLECRNGSEVFIKYANVKLPDTSNSWYNMSMNMQECEAECLKNCTCTAYAIPDSTLGGRGCLLWFDDLLDIRVYTQGNGGTDIFVRMDSSELVAQSNSSQKQGAKIKIILPVIFAGVLFICFISIWLWYARKKKNHAEPTEEGPILDVSKSREETMELPLFSFSAIANATANFSPDNKLGEGGFGPVYKGVLDGGKLVAVKRLSTKSSQGTEEFMNEVICISKLQHRNLVKLLGCCIQGDEKLLIYEYMPNKSLDLFIFDKTQSMLLDWTMRFKIIKGIARGLVYLHQDSRLRIIHRDLKASNILLDHDMNPKISDFGIARSFGGNESQANTERVVGTYGYMSPEYAVDGIFSVKSDAFSFGVLVLEIVSGKRNRGFTEQEHNNLMGHAWTLYNEGRSMDLIDATIAESCHPQEVLRSVEVGLLCVQQRAEDRPNMSSVIMMLGGEVELLQPKQPAYFMEREFLVSKFSTSTNPGSSTNELTMTEVEAR